MRVDPSVSQVWISGSPRMQVQQSSLVLCFCSSSWVTSIRRPLRPVRSFPLLEKRIQSIRLWPGFKATWWVKGQSHELCEGITPGLKHRSVNINTPAVHVAVISYNVHCIHGEIGVCASLHEEETAVWGVVVQSVTLFLPDCPEGATRCWEPGAGNDWVGTLSMLWPLRRQHQRPRRPVQAAAATDTRTTAPRSHWLLGVTDTQTLPRWDTSLLSNAKLS